MRKLHWVISANFLTAIFWKAASNGLQAWTKFRSRSESGRSQSRPTLVEKRLAVPQPQIFKNLVGYSVFKTSKTILATQNGVVLMLKAKSLRNRPLEWPTCSLLKLVETLQSWSEVGSTIVNLQRCDNPNPLVLNAHLNLKLTSMIPRVSPVFRAGNRDL